MTVATLPEIPLPIKGDVAGVYVIRNNVSGRIYVGSSIKIKKRWKHHLNGLRKGTNPSPYLQKSWTKHGEEAFSFEVIEEVQNISELIPREQFWIDHLSAYSSKTGLNARPVADSPLGRVMSAEQRLRISLQRKGKPHAPEHAAKLRALMIARNQSQESRARSGAIIAAVNSNPESRLRTIERNKSAEGRRRSAKTFLGKRHTKETLEKISTKAKTVERLSISMANLSYAIQLGGTHTKEAREKMSASRRGKKRAPFTESHKAAISAAKTEYYRKKRTNKTTIKINDIPPPP